MSNTELPSGPPWSLDVVADVHAGVYSPQDTQRLRTLIADDQEAAAMLAALDAVVDDLSLLPAPVMPAQYVSRLDAALLAESQAREAAGPVASVTPLRPLAAVPPPAAVPPLPSSAVPTGAATPLPPAAVPAGVGDLAKARRRRQSWFAGIGAVAAAAVIGTVVVVNLPGGTAGTGSVGDAAPQAGVQDPVNLLQYYTVLDNGISRAVPVDSLAGCLEALQIPTALGAAEGTLDEQDVILIVTADLGDAPANADQVRVVIVEAGCSADGATVVRESLSDR